MTIVRKLVQIGNAVPCLLGKAIGLSLRKMLDDYHGFKEIKVKTIEAK